MGSHQTTISDLSVMKYFLRLLNITSCIIYSLTFRRMDTGDEDIGNIQLVGSSVGEAAPPIVYQNLRPEIGEKLLQQGITSLDQLSQRKNPPKETIIERKIFQKSPIKPKRVIYPVPVYHYVPYFRHSVSHHINENHRHYFY